MNQAEELKKERANVDAALKGLLESIAEVRVLREQLRQAEAQNRQLAAQVDSLTKVNDQLRDRLNMDVTPPSWPQVAPWGPITRPEPPWDPLRPPYHFACESNITKP